MIQHIKIEDKQLQNKIQQKEIAFGGNKKLKIYGTLHCKSGKRMKRENRVFFPFVEQAENQGYRLCGHCMKPVYKKMKKWTCLTRNCRKNSWGNL